jgi:peptidoglycan/LPS O-acetylase OafA/YrhL
MKSSTSWRSVYLWLIPLFLAPFFFVFQASIHPETFISNIGKAIVMLCTAILATLCTLTCHLVERKMRGDSDNTKNPNLRKKEP